jgi:hypothetical protein
LLSCDPVRGLEVRVLLYPLWDHSLVVEPMLVEHMARVRFSLVPHMTIHEILECYKVGLYTKKEAKELIENLNKKLEQEKGENLTIEKLKRMTEGTGTYPREKKNPWEDTQIWYSANFER